jgi:hypothetical protein
MKRNRIEACMLLAALLPTVGACASDTDDVDAEEELRRASAVTLRLYNKPRTYRPIGEGTCEPFTRATLKVGSRIASAQLETAADTGCRVLIQKELRSYRMQFVSQDTCGAKTFRGTRTLGSAAVELTLVDHRGARCDVLPPGAIELAEVDRATQRTVKMYSSDRATALGTIALNGGGAPYLHVAPGLNMSIDPSLAGVDLRAGMQVRLKGTFLALPIEDAPFPTLVVEESLPR